MCRSGADLQQLQSFKVHDAAADTLGGVEQDVRLGGERIAQDTDADPVHDQVGAPEVTKRNRELASTDCRHVVVVVDRLAEDDARAALQQLDPLWDELFPAEQARIVALLVERIDIGTNGLNFRLRMDGLGGLAREMLSGSIGAAA